ncbi:hypothetical protein Q9S71_01875 [Microbacterium sp. KSW4-11]|uniref:Uncharacterized protein n=1 Tax=Microbacterium gawkjiense TaxID=3067309 RepID=A0ABU3G7S7_9MICO|nr:hypothetical protein [Microbacterium sp. KSW4-11]MDT3315560.1 hypothetical protein [Microbacterium sp. KSW4-11]
MRLLRLAAVLLTSLALAGCVSTASLESEQSPTPSAERTPAASAEQVTEPPRCAEWAGDTTMLINLDEVLGVIEPADPMAGWTASGNDLVRGDGACAPVSTQPVGTVETCAAPDASLDDVSRAVSSAPVEYMFAVGAERQIAGYVEGRTTAEEYLVLGMQAWRFATPAEAQAAPILDALAACEGSQAGDGRVRIFEGTEPAVVASLEGRDVFVVRSARPVTTEGEDAGLTATESSLLPEASVNAAEEWWQTQAAAAFSREPRG